MRSRTALAYVVEVNGPRILLNFREGHKGQVAGHLGGFSLIGQPDDLIGIDAGSELLVLKIESIAFAEPREAHRQGIGSEDVSSVPLKQIRAHVLGYLKQKNQNWIFTPEEWHLPALGSEAFPLGSIELAAITTPESEDPSELLTVGHDPRNPNVRIRVKLNDYLSRHVAILGSTGQGKTHFIAAFLHQLINMPKARIVIFDVNGEYAKAFQDFPPNWVKLTVLGTKNEQDSSQSNWFKIPYYALGRHGLARLLLPSEKTQLPALRFAVENLHFVFADKNGARLIGKPNNCLFDDCRRSDAKDALSQLEILRQGNPTAGTDWPHMRALSCLIAEWSCLGKDRNGEAERNAFNYSNVAPLVNRIRGFIEDEQFRDVVSVNGGTGQNGKLSWRKESKNLVNEIFGNQNYGSGEWKIHIVDLRRLTQDLMPFVLGSLLELYASELFRRGPGKSHPTVLVLEEAHHYLRQISSDESSNYSLAYERLAKEGRKFGLSLIVSTQRPSEISPTVLAQCGTWSVFRLTNERDQRAVSAAAEFGSQNILKQIPGLPRGNAVLLGAAMRIPLRVQVVRPLYEPESMDAQFLSCWSDDGGKVEEESEFESLTEPSIISEEVENEDLDAIFNEDEIPF